MKKIKYILVVFLATFYSCDNYLDINDSPNNPTSNLVNPKLGLSAAITRPYRTFTLNSNQLGNIWMNNWTGNVNQITGAYATEFSLQIGNNFYNPIWDNYFLLTVNLQNIINYDSADYDNHKAIAKIMKTFYFQHLVDIYGDIPYSEAHVKGILTPAYDDDLSVYRNLYTQLDEAIALIENSSANANTIAVGAEDPVFAGDMTGWVKFANTIKLRLLIRESGYAATNAESATYLASKYAELASATFITEDVTVNPGYSNASNDQINPFYFTYGLDAAGNPGTSAQVVVATKHAIDFLSGNLPNTIPDVRISKIYAPVSGSTYVGNVQGVEAPIAPPAISRLGNGLLVGPDQDGYLMTASESYFLQSEAVWRGSLAGDAKALFESGIQASFDLLGVPASGASYIANSNSVNGLGWDASTNKLQAIMTQKWVALNGINGLESFIEFTRTGFPATGVSTVANFPSLPKRLLYPTSELTGNTANVPNVTLSQIFTQGAFWDVP
ncbi:SusD/RagB family nutrient-binding outer membrane lipoprotein [Flavobacterium aquatile]|uniref:SusD/RagB family nutrient-binding outer membrane lipoprotein n=1 Tax=Flavobacterium aquatile LMG 4008 = ATCC 11947 TaxID=1453498 RepID=A0A095U4D6_9FLAO|nr:SusD/RagB family nutrient-binding outer membrane lipoprotein [Flavobacterium aquatile]KGD69518.1 hypothetical protein LG45_01770 [Flavobacterium aquatile LMG 4008 = ATCC 11947]OXA66028.1 hypothetical protein B0A61_12165 [Flavobacterium aquatile LMG 4008 = ATCC 11947]GEC77502.1 hypothetical protein FAQ01_03720 [Flavobacterium aquatile]